MNDLLPVILVGLVVLTAVVSVFVILSKPSEPYSDADYPPSDSHSARDAHKKKQRASA